MAITYKNSPQGFKVYLDGKLTGIIKQRIDGFVYWPKGAKSPSEPFPTLAAMKRSIEGTEEWICPNCGREYFRDDAAEVKAEFSAHPNHECFEDCPGDIDPHPERS